MLTASNRFEAELQKRIAKEIERLRDEMGQGRLTDYPHYKHYCGQIAALQRVAVEYCSEIQTKLEKG